MMGRVLTDASPSSPPQSSRRGWAAEKRSIVSRRTRPTVDGQRLELSAAKPTSENGASSLRKLFGPVPAAVRLTSPTTRSCRNEGYCRLAISQVRCNCVRPMSDSKRANAAAGRVRGASARV